jgi:hypothetical protein
MTTTQKCEHPGCNCQPAIGKKHCSTDMCRRKEESRDTVPVQAPGMRRYRTQDVAWPQPDSAVSREFIFDIRPISTVKGKTLHGTFCNIRNNSGSTCTR